MINFDSELQNMIGEGFKFNQVTNKLKEQHFITLRQDGLLKALKGLTTLEEVFRVAQL